jgi:hypothetical protein
VDGSRFVGEEFEALFPTAQPCPAGRSFAAARSGCIEENDDPDGWPVVREWVDQFDNDGSVSGLAAR